MLGAKVYYGLRSEKEVAFKSHLEQRHENHSKQELAFFVQNLINSISKVHQRKLVQILSTIASVHQYPATVNPFVAKNQILFASVLIFKNHLVTINISTTKMPLDNSLLTDIFHVLTCYK